MNTKEGESGDVDVLASQWRFHPTDAATDVAVLEWPATATDFDMLTWPILQASATDEAMRKWGIGVGDEVFMIGLFHKHYGKTKNIPIMRIGNIAAMPEEPIAMRTGPDALMDAYLIEMRSIGGLSGSPVFVRTGPVWGARGRARSRSSCSA